MQTHIRHTPPPDLTSRVATLEAKPAPVDLTSRVQTLEGRVIPPDLTNRVTTLEGRTIPPDLTSRVTTLEARPTPVDLTSRVTDLEAKNVPPVTVPATSPASTLTAADQILIPAAPASQPVPTANLSSSTWVLVPHTDGCSGYVQGNAAIYWRIVWTPTGYIFSCQGIVDASNPWFVVEKIGAGSTTRATTGTLALQTITRTSTANYLDVKAPGGKTWNLTRPRTDMMTGWVATQDTRLGILATAYWKGAFGCRVLWGKSSAWVIMTGAGDWNISTTFLNNTSSNQVSSVVGVATNWVECNGAEQVGITAPDGSTLTLYKSNTVQTWASIEQPKSDRTSTIWGLADISLASGQSYREWRKPNNDYVRITFAPFTRVEVFTPTATFDWYRLTRADGTTITRKDSGSFAQQNEVFALVEVWLGSSALVSAPTTTPTIISPIPCALDSVGIPQQWQDYIDFLTVDATPTGRMIKALKTQISSLSDQLVVATQKLSSFQYATGAEVNTGWVYNTKPVYTQCFVGTTPNNNIDNTLFTIAGASQILNYEGFYTQAGNSRSASLSMMSGNTAHGLMFQFYTNVAHWYNATGDSRHQNCPYWVRAWYIK